MWPDFNVINLREQLGHLGIERRPFCRRTTAAAVFLGRPVFFFLWANIISQSTSKLSSTTCYNPVTQRGSYPKIDGSSETRGNTGKALRVMINIVYGSDQFVVPMLFLSIDASLQWTHPVRLAMTEESSSCHNCAIWPTRTVQQTRSRTATPQSPLLSELITSSVSSSTCHSTCPRGESRAADPEPFPTVSLDEVSRIPSAIRHGFFPQQHSDVGFFFRIKPRYDREGEGLWCGLWKLLLVSKSRAMVEKAFPESKAGEQEWSCGFILQTPGLSVCNSGSKYDATKKCNLKKNQKKNPFK